MPSTRFSAAAQDPMTNGPDERVALADGVVQNNERGNGQWPHRNGVPARLRGRQAHSGQQER